MEETLELYQLHYSDLLLLSSDQKPASENEIQRLQLISKAIMQNLGPKGPGLISINGIPKARNLRHTLLSLARKLALLNNDDRKRILKEHNLGSDVPLKNLDRIVSSFAMQMKYGQEFSDEFKDNKTDIDASDLQFRELGFAFRELGICIMELGLCLARVCDDVIGGNELEQSLLQCGSAKGRLIHYHSDADNVIINESAKGQGKVRLDGGGGGKSDLWQQWHYDYGIFTILTSPMFMLSNGGEEQECEAPEGHTYLQVYHPNKNRVLMVKASKESCIVQVGESADVLSKGKLRATLHCVCRPSGMDKLSRETFVVFLQPAWSKKFSLLDYPVEYLAPDDEGKCETQQKSNGLSRKIHEIVPPLFERLRDGMTFAEFSKETTKQYYGGRGLQSNK